MLIEWNEQTAGQIEALKDDAVVAVNFSSTEQHSKYLPVGTDAFLGESVLKSGAQKAKSKVLTLPPVRYGYSPHHKFASGYLTITQSVLASYAADICECVAEQGFHKLVIVNSHGGNYAYLSCVVNEIGEKYENDIDVALFRYWDLAADSIAAISEGGPNGMGHAGEFETSVMMYLKPELVIEDNIFTCDAPEGDEWYQPGLVAPKKYHKFTSFNKYNPNGNIGLPHLATAEKGKAFFDAAADKLADFFDYFMKK